MNVECTDNKTFKLTDDRQLIGQLNYKSFFSFKAEIVLPNSEHYDIESVGFFGTSITVTRKGRETANLQMNWKGQIIMTMHKGQQFVFKSKGIFGNKYFIEDKVGKELLILEPNFTWSKMNYNYDIFYEDKPQDILLVLLGVYAANYYIAAMAGSI